MKKSYLILCLGLITSLGATETVTPAAAPSAQKPLPSPAQVELAQKVIKASNAARMFDQMSAQMQQMAAQSMGLSRQNQTPAQKEAATKYMGEVMKLSMDTAKSLMDDFDLIFAEVYTEAELKAMLAFYESPEGKSMLEKQPQVMKYMMPLVQDMQKKLMPKIQEIAKRAKDEAAAAAAAVAPVAVAPAGPADAKVE